MSLRTDLRPGNSAAVWWPFLLSIACLAAMFPTVAAPPVGPALDPSLTRPVPEPAGPSSRRSPVLVTEIHYNPRGPGGTGTGEFVEVFNSNPWPEELGGWRLDGDIRFTFPEAYVLPARARVVVAASPAGFNTFTNILTVLGPFEGTLPNGGGTLRLRNRLGAVVWETEYQDSLPWPVSPDGAGPSLVLARPSYGESDPRAWSASERTGGSPGTDEPAPSGIRTVVINEVLAHTIAPAEDFIELFNNSASDFDLSGCRLSDDPAVDRFILPPGTVLGAGARLSFTTTQLGFGLSAEGQTVLLRSADGQQVLDAVKYGAQSAGTSTGRFPDGARNWTRLSVPTPGTPNPSPLQPPVVLNEIHYHPISDDSDSEFVEVHNPGSAPVDLSGWRLGGGIEFTFPSGAVLRPGGHLAVARSAATLHRLHPDLDASNLIGNFEGKLGDGGDRIELSMPARSVTVGANGQRQTNSFQVVVDQVTYHDGGRWGRWSDGGGSSLELRDPHAPRDLAPNWADSDESRTSGWVMVEATGIVGLGNQTPNALEVLLYGAGECLLDRIEVIPAGSTNVLVNGDFEANTTGWNFQGNHSSTFRDTSEGFESQASLHLRATGAGHTGPNRIRVPLIRNPPTGRGVTLRARVRWLRGSPNLLLRLHGNWFDAPGSIRSTIASGTPGRRNSTAVDNAGPAITDVTHFPVLPRNVEDVRVVARVADPDGLSDLFVRWRREPAMTVTDIPMTHHGAGLYSAVIPGQINTTIGAFHIVGRDGTPTAVTSTFPSNPATQECLVRWGDPAPTGVLGAYRLWMARTNVTRWTNREKLSNDPLDATFAYGNSRVIYNAGAMYSGSPFHTPSYNGPAGIDCDYVVHFPDDDTLLGATEINLLKPGNGGGDTSCQAEQHAYWMASQLGIPHCHQRPVLLHFNGVRRGQIYTDAQQPEGDFVRQWFPDDPEGELRKIQLWFEFDPAGTTFDVVGADLSNYTVGGVRRPTRYRWNWPRRSYGNNPGDFTELFRLVDAVNTTATGDDYTRILSRATDVDEWFRVHVIEHLVGNNDSYSYGGGQNMYAYRPANGPWRLLIWDIDFAFAGADPRSDLFNIGGRNVGPVNNHPPFQRLYWQALIDAANGPLRTNRYLPMLNARYQAMRTNGAAGVTDPAFIRTYLDGRRQHVDSLLVNKAYPFAFTSNGGRPLTSPSNQIQLTGTAPLTVHTLLVNGTAVNAQWTSMSNWTAALVLPNGTTRLELSGLDPRGRRVTNASAFLNVTVGATPESPEGRIVFSEILHHPVTPGTAFIELRNLSTNTAFDLSGWRIDGINTVFPAGSLLAPGAYGLIVEDADAFARLNGSLLRTLATFGRALDPAGQTLRLIRPATASTPESVVATLNFEASLPWPAAALAGSSLQLANPRQDPSRPASWVAVRTDGTLPGSEWQRVAVTGLSGSDTLRIELLSGGEVHLDDVRLYPASSPDGAQGTLLANGGFELPLAGTWTINSGAAFATVNAAVRASGSRSLLLGSPTGAGPVVVSQRLASPLRSDVPHTLSFTWLASPGNAPTATLRVGTADGQMSVQVGLGPVTPSTVARTTPGRANSVGTTRQPIPPIHLNELLVENRSGPVDNTGKRQPWIELFNSGSEPVSLDGLHLTDDPEAPTRWTFPSGTVLAARSFLLVWLDGIPTNSALGHLHAGFGANRNGGSIALTRVEAGEVQFLDYLAYPNPGPDRSIGFAPDANRSRRRTLESPTPGSPNTLAAAASPIRINEWMASNGSTIRNPATGNYDDWFEIHNAGEVPFDLSGHWLGTDPAAPFLFRIPVGATVPAQGFLLVWADRVTSPATTNDPSIHANFRLSANGESILLSDPEGALLDRVTFGPQTRDVSEGRAGDGGILVGALPEPTPAEPNAVPPPEFLRIDPEPGSVTLTWQSFPGLRYQLESTPDLLFPEWSAEGPPLIAAGTAIVAQPPATTEVRFYRVIQER